MTTYKGQNGQVDIGANAVAETTTFNIEETAETPEDTAQGDEWRSFKSGLKSWSGSMDVWWDPGDTLGQVVLEIGAETSATFHPAGDTQAQNLSGTIIVNSRNITSETENIVTATIGFQGSGELVKANN